MNTEDVMAGLVPGKRSREELNKANDLLLKEHRAYLASWKEAVTAPQTSEKQVNEHEGGPPPLLAAKEN
jgi:hypothetical protein